MIIDNQMGMRCLELTEQYGIPALVMDGFQIANELTFQIARHFNRSGRPCQAQALTCSAPYCIFFASPSPAPSAGLFSIKLRNREWWIFRSWSMARA